MLLIILLFGIQQIFFSGSWHLSDGAVAYLMVGSSRMDEHLTMTSPPEKTSFGAVSMQLRTAARTLGLDKKMDASELRELANCLQRDVFNIKLVAKYLYQLAERDNFQQSLPNLSEEQIRVIGARYNRGVALPLEEIRNDTSYGDFIVKNWHHFSILLMPAWEPE